MYLLPDLEPWCGGQCWLSADGVMEFGCQLLDSYDHRQSIDRWMTLLRWEPGLVLWAASGLRWRLDDPPTLLELAQWLHHEASRTLQPWHDKQPEVSTDMRATCSRRAGNAIAVARAVSLLGGTESAEVQAMLRGAPSSVGPAWLRRCHRNTPLPAELKSEARRLVGTAENPGGLSRPRLVWRTARRQVAQRWRFIARPLPLGTMASSLCRNERLELRFSEQLQSEKLAYGASHEINNPLANITTRAQSLLRDEQDPQRQRKLAAIVSQAFRAHEMISDMMLFARPPQLERQAVDLVAIAEQCIAEVQREPEWEGATMTMHAPEESLEVSADPNHLGEALRAIYRNALEATEGRGRIDISVIRSDSGVEVAVEDDGPGLDSRQRRHLFDPFFSGREAGRGLGLGLAKAWTITQAHDGRIAVSDGTPTRITLWMPQVANS